MDFYDPPKGKITSGFVSKHFGTDKQYNESNDGVGYLSPEGWLAGYYKNSLGKDSLYGGKEFRTNLLGNENLGLDAALVAGLVSGYGNKINPLLLPELIARYKAHELALGLVPPVKGVTPMTLALQLRKSF
jgi:hypothetical protein